MDVLLVVELPTFHRQVRWEGRKGLSRLGKGKGKGIEH